MPRLTDELTLQLETMGQVGRNGDGDWLSGWSSYAGLNWKQQTDSSVKPYASLGVHFMSGDKNAATEDGGHHAWDPMWARGVCDSEIFLYGTHYGIAWWMWALADDGMGGDDGHFKGYLSQARYDFPIMLPDKAAGERLEIVGHLYAELFNPGDYFETDRPAWFLRWQVELRF